MPMENYNIIIVALVWPDFVQRWKPLQQGASVLVLEKQTEIGGSSLLSGCFMAFAGTDLQKKQGINDSTEMLNKRYVSSWRRYE